MTASEMGWLGSAACRSRDPELFFPVSPTGPAAERQVADAKTVCATCPVRAECLEFALRTRQVHGVWGGLSEQELRLLRRADARPSDMAAGQSHRDRVPANDSSGPERLTPKPPGCLPAAG